MSYPPRGPCAGLIGQGGPTETDHQRLERKLDELQQQVNRIWDLLSHINHALICVDIIPENRS